MKVMGYMVAMAAIAVTAVAAANLAEHNAQSPREQRIEMTQKFREAMEGDVIYSLEMLDMGLSEPKAARLAIRYCEQQREAARLGNGDNVEFSKRARMVMSVGCPELVKR